MLNTLQRIQGCIIGLAAGDALGDPVEFSSLEGIKERFGPLGIQHYAGKVGRITDDTQMSLAVIAGFDATLAGFGVAAPLPYFGWDSVDTVGDLFGPEVAKAFVQWLIKPMGGHRSPGGCCLAGTGNLRSGVDWKKSGIKGNGGGCGGIMRSAPYGLLLGRCGTVPTEGALLAGFVAAKHARMTHDHPMGFAAAGAQAAGVAMGINGCSVEETVGAMVAITKDLDPVGTYPMVLDAIDAAKRSGNKIDPKVFERYPAWRGDHALASVIHILLCHPDDVVAAIRAGANISGDSDSLASMAGALVGVRTGLSNLRGHFHDNVEFKSALDYAVDRTHAMQARMSGKEDEET